MKFHNNINAPNLLTKIVKSIGSENRTGREPIAPLHARSPVNSPSTITLENNGNFQPMGQIENGLDYEAA